VDAPRLVRTVADVLLGALTLNVVQPDAVRDDALAGERVRYLTSDVPERIGSVSK